MMLRAYAAGFEKAVFAVTSPDEWRSLLPLAREWVGSRSKKPFHDMLPQFVQKVYPTYWVDSGVTGDFDSDSSDLRVVVWWKGPTLCIGVEVGSRGSFLEELYRRQPFDGVSIVVFRGAY